VTATKGSIVQNDLAEEDTLAPPTAEELKRDMVDLTRSLFALVLPADPPPSPREPVAQPVDQPVAQPVAQPPAARPTPPASIPLPASVPLPTAPEPALPAVAPGPEPIPLPDEPVRHERARGDRTMSLLDEISFLDD
jgi:hypothetical protein